jgi:hypothetical protein
MGTFGTDISENDLYKDLQIEFFDLYNAGIDAQTVSEKVIKNHNESLNSDEDSNNFWLAIADFQWNCKSLNNEVLNKVNKIVESKSDLDLWRELDASENDINDREKRLNEFLAKITKPKKRAKRRIKKKLYNSIFKKGDLVIYKLENDNYGGSLVIQEEKNTELGLNQLVLTDINQKNKPTFRTFRKSKIQYRKEELINGQKKFHPWILFFYGNNYLKEVDEDFGFEVLENVKIKNPQVDFKRGWVNWGVLRDIPTCEIYSEIKEPITLKKWLNKKSWF